MLAPYWLHVHKFKERERENWSQYCWMVHKALNNFLRPPVFLLVSLFYVRHNNTRPLCSTLESALLKWWQMRNCLLLHLFFTLHCFFCFFQTPPSFAFFKYILERSTERRLCSPVNLNSGKMCSLYLMFSDSPDSQPSVPVAVIQSSQSVWCYFMSDSEVVSKARHNSLMVCLVSLCISIPHIHPSVFLPTYIRRRH